MRPERLMTLPATLTRVTHTGAVDVYNNPTDVTQTVSVLCWFEQLSADERTGSQDQQSETHRVFFPADVDPTGWDRVAVNGLVLELVGPPWQPVNPRTGAAWHWVGKARQVV